MRASSVPSGPSVVLASFPATFGTREKTRGIRTRGVGRYVTSAENGMRYLIETICTFRISCARGITTLSREAGIKFLAKHALYFDVHGKLSYIGSGMVVGSIPVEGSLAQLTEDVW